MVRSRLVGTVFIGSDGKASTWPDKSFDYNAHTPRADLL